MLYVERFAVKGGSVAAWLRGCVTGSNVGSNVVDVVRETGRTARQWASKGDAGWGASFKQHHSGKARQAAG